MTLTAVGRVNSKHSSGWALVSGPSRRKPSSTAERACSDTSASAVDEGRGSPPSGTRIVAAPAGKDSSRRPALVSRTMTGPS
jgi:hypothetical protein